MSYTKLEQETIINFNEAEKTANIYTYNQKLRRQLETLISDRPGEIEFKSANSGAVTYNIPKSWVKIRPPRVLSEAQKKVLARINPNVNI